MTRCRLCEKSGDLCESHIVPKFVVRWLKETSATGIRQAAEPNRRAQDGWKRPFLCRTCESTLNKWETPFSAELFVPFHQQAPLQRIQTFSYGDWCLPFCVSLSWRVLKVACEDGLVPSLSEQQRAAVESALSNWRDVQLGRRSHPGQHEQYVFPFGLLAAAPLELVSPFQNRYFLRTIQIDVLADDESVVVFSKLGRLAVIGFVTPADRRWKGWKVHVRKGAFPIQTFRMPHVMVQYLKDAAEGYGQIYEEMSPRQQGLAASGTAVAIREEMDSFVAFKADVRISGDAARRTRTTRGT